MTQPDQTVPDAGDTGPRQDAGENERLGSPRGRLAFARSCRLLSRGLPAPPAAVADIGGGPGRYAEWLGRQGYAVSLVDLAPERVERAGRHLAAHAGCRAVQGDARALPLADASQDAVLLMGPLSHLNDLAERRQALAEALRVLRPGGILFATALSRHAVLLDGLWQGRFSDPDFAVAAREGLETGRQPGSDGLSEAWLHRPGALQAEVRAAGFVQSEVVGIEGPAWLMPTLAEVQQRDFAWPLLDLLERLERDPDILAMSRHLMATGFKPVQA